MVSNNTPLSRRTLLKATSGTLIGGSFSGITAGDPNDPIEVNIGWSHPSARSEAIDAAVDVRREFSFDALTARLPRAAIQGLRRRSDVRYVEENGTMRASDQTLPWGVDRVDADVVHADNVTGSGVDVAIIDTGIDSDHPGLSANLGAGTSFLQCGGSCQCPLPEQCHGPNGNTCHESWDDDNDHGTHCAGIAAAPDDGQGVVGVAPEATLHAVKVLGPSGCGSFSDIAAGLEYVADQSWDVANMSLGGGSSSVVEDAVDYAYNRGVFMVAAAGNTPGGCTDCVQYPAAYDKVMAVSATESDDDFASYSHQGPEIEITAPGTSVYSTVAGGYGTFSGTSMAAPHVAGAGALLTARGSTASAISSQLTSTAEDIGLSSNQQGAGILDVEAAVGISPLEVHTLAANDVSSIWARLNGDLEGLGGGDPVDVHFEWGPINAGYPNSTATLSFSYPTSFSTRIENLQPSTEYEFVAVAEASDGTVDQGYNQTFTTAERGSKT